MTAWIKKMLVLLPVMVITGFYIADTHLVRADNQHRIVLLSLTFFLLYGWMFWEVWRRRQDNVYQLGMQASFLVYIFMVLTLTGYFILFREVSLHHWWDNMAHRISRRDHVNLKLLKVFRIYKVTHKQVLGNLVMLFPLGIYLPILYRRCAGLLHVFAWAFLFSVTIELLQLATSFRSADIDDVMLNTTGACLGYGCWWLAQSFRKPVPSLVPGMQQ